MLLLCFVWGVVVIVATNFIQIERKIFLASIYRCALVFSMPVFLWIVVRSTSVIPYLQKFLRASGIISLEIYLLHIYNRPLSLVRKFVLSDEYFSILLTFVIVYIVAYAINYMIKIVVSKLFDINIIKRN